VPVASAIRKPAIVLERSWWVAGKRCTSGAFSKKDDPALANENNFAYFDKDSHGMACPMGSHVRPLESQGFTWTRMPRPLWRHESSPHSAPRPFYGHRLENQLVDDGAERGLHFICLNSDIERQFEFVQQTWINSPVFSGLYDEVVL